MNELTLYVVNSAQRAVEAAQSRGTRQLDFTFKSLELLEEMTAEASQWIDQMSGGQVQGLIQQFGSYILEVARQEFGGRYNWYDAREQPVLVVGEPDYRIAIMTWDKVKGRLSGDLVDNIPFFYAGFAERVRKSVPGDDVLYV